MENAPNDREAAFNCVVQPMRLGSAVAKVRAGNLFPSGVTRTSRRETMDQTLFALPILPGQGEAARAFLTELEGPRKGQYAASEKILGLTKEVWAIQSTPQGEMYVVYFVGDSIARAFRRFAA